MCGIVGILQTDGAPVPRSVLAVMTDSLAHRGPDGSGIEIRGQVGLGHRRLAIIDLEGGAQPLSNEDGQVWITFNGEIYNYRELRGELQARGHQFRTQSDTETVVHAYEEWGERCVERLRGMFAFGLMDWRQARLFLARDHLGIKPLYFVQTPQCFAFASELQALRLLPNLRPDLDLQAIDQYLWLQYIPAPRTAFRQIQKLLPAHHLSVTLDGQVSGPEEYWRLKFRPDHRRSRAEWLEALDEVLRDSVRAHLVADVPFGAFLSGGVDSSAVVAYMAHMLDQPVCTFSIGFEEEDFDELPYAGQAAERWGTAHHVEIVRPNALEILPELVHHYGEPFGDRSALPTYYVCQMARRHVPMVLSGDGGDEAFAGYDSYRAWLRWLAYDGIPPWKLSLYPLARTLMPWRYPPRRPTLGGWLNFVDHIPFSERRSLWRPEYHLPHAAPPGMFEREFARTAGYPPCSMVQYLDLKTYLPYAILTKVDVASMMHGLEVRTPIVDVRVVEFAATIPEAFSIARNGAGQWEGKLLLRQAMQRYYPAESLCRPKMGFSIPIQRWFGPDGAWREKIKERLTGPSSTLLEFFEPTAIGQSLAKNHSSSLWLLLFLEEWLRQNRATSESVISSRLSATHLGEGTT